MFAHIPDCVDKMKAGPNKKILRKHPKYFHQMPVGVIGNQSAGIKRPFSCFVSRNHMKSCAFTAAHTHHGDHTRDVCHDKMSCHFLLL